MFFYKIDKVIDLWNKNLITVQLHVISPPLKKGTLSKSSDFFILTQVGFAELKKTADNRANIDGTIIGAPIVGQ